MMTVASIVTVIIRMHDQQGMFSEPALNADHLGDLEIGVPVAGLEVYAILLVVEHHLVPVAWGVDCEAQHFLAAHHDGLPPKLSSRLHLDAVLAVDVPRLFVDQAHLNPVQPRKLLEHASVVHPPLAYKICLIISLQALTGSYNKPRISHHFGKESSYYNQMRLFLRNKSDDKMQFQQIMDQYASNHSVNRKHSNKDLTISKYIEPSPNQSYNYAPSFNQNAIPPPPRYQNLPNPTLPTEVSMEGLNVQVPSQPAQHYEITPPCYHWLFMLPFPCFMMGCCLSLSAYFEFNNQARTLELCTYCGHCSCCAKTETIAYADIVRLKDEVVPTRYKRAQGGFENLHRLVLQTKLGEFQIAYPAGKTLLQPHKKQLDLIMARCGIHLQP